MLTNKENTMLAAVNGVPSQFALGWDTVNPVVASVSTGLKCVRVCGLGGSAFPGDILRTVFSDAGIQIEVVRDYLQDDYEPKTCLFIVSSFSGNTEETLSMYAELRERGEHVVAVTAGGRLAELAEVDGIPLVKFVKPSPTFQPRAASAMFVAAYAHLMVKYGLLDNPSEVRERLMGCGRYLELVQAETRARGEQLAEDIKGRIPVFLTGRRFGRSLGQVAKIKINENSKTPAFWNVIPEFNHNEMVGYTRLHDGVAIVAFRDDQDLPRMQHRMDRTIATLQTHGVWSVSNL